jgi:hypothetical protein
LEERGLATATAFRVKELLRWVRNADTQQGARWRATRFFEFTRELTWNLVLLAPVRKALNAFQEHLPRILRRWDSLLSNARRGGLEAAYPNLVRVPEPVVTVEIKVFSTGLDFRVDGWDSLKH